MSLLEAHRAFLGRALDQLIRDPRVAAVLAAGSTGRGEEDEWSDLDLVVVCGEPTATVVASPVDAERFGDLAIWVDCSFNAPIGATQAFARYLTPDGMVLVDWNAWPLAAARLTTGSRMLWSRPGVTIEPFDGTFYDLVVSRPRRVIPPYSRQQRAEWELCMCHLALSLPARRRDARRALLTIGITDDPGANRADQVKAIGDHISKLRAWIPSRILGPSLQRVQAVTAALVADAVPERRQAGPNVAATPHPTQHGGDLGDERNGPDWYCQVLAGAAEADIVAQTATAVALRPSLASGDERIVVVPKRHVPSLLQAEPRDLIDVMTLVQQIAGETVGRFGSCHVVTSISSEEHEGHLYWEVAAGEDRLRSVAPD